MAHTLTHPHTGTEHYETSDAAHPVVDERVQRERYGGFHFGAAFFGWLVSVGIGTILSGILAAAGGALAVTKIAGDTLTVTKVTTISFVSGVLLLLILAVAYFVGGYVAGRLVRFDGARQGLGVWLIGVLMTLLLGAIGALLGAKYNVLQQINLPHIPIKQGSLTTGGLITSLVAIAVTLLAAVVGGRLGVHYHRRIDKAGTVTR
jgi:hypothetical protein